MALPGAEEQRGAPRGAATAWLLPAGGLLRVKGASLFVMWQQAETSIFPGKAGGCSAPSRGLEETRPTKRGARSLGSHVRASPAALSAQRPLVQEMLRERPAPRTAACQPVFLLPRRQSSRTQGLLEPCFAPQDRDWPPPVPARQLQPHWHLPDPSERLRSDQSGQRFLEQSKDLGVPIFLRRGPSGTRGGDFSP